MMTSVQQWGNSLGVRLPKSVAEEAAIRAGSKVRISVKDGQVVIVPEVARRYTLEELVAGITTKNRHGEAFADAPRGREVW